MRSLATVVLSAVALWTLVPQFLGFSAVWAKLGDANRWMELTRTLPFGRLAEPDEIAHLAVFCASPRCGYLSGTVLHVDGGQNFATPAK